MLLLLVLLVQVLVVVVDGAAVAKLLLPRLVTNKVVLLFFSPLDAPRVSACIIFSLVVLAVCVMSTVWYYFGALYVVHMFENFQAGLIYPVRRSSIYLTDSID